jgi:hypothetical protein
MSWSGHEVADRLSKTPALHLADQVLSSGTTLLGIVVVSRRADPQELGVFSIFLTTYFLATGFSRAVPQAVAMTLAWDDERARNSWFFLSPLMLGGLGTAVLVPTFAILDPSFIALACILLPLLLQDAIRMRALATGRPLVAVASDATWVAVAAAGLLLTLPAAGAALAWALGGLAGLVVGQPWLVRVAWPRRAEGTGLLSATLEYGTVAGLVYLTPLAAGPIISLAGVGALQGANVIRGPFLLLGQALMLHRMAGPPITPTTCVGEALRLSGAVLGGTLACVPPVILLRDLYGPPLLGATWPAVEPLIVPALLTMVGGSLTIGPLTVVRKMGRFPLAALIQAVLAPLLFGLPLVGAAVAGARGFLSAGALAAAVGAALWWAVLVRLPERTASAGPTA